jgi:large subunit ribosomal protein L7/L12
LGKKEKAEQIRSQHVLSTWVRVKERIGLVSEKFAERSLDFAELVAELLYEFKPMDAELEFVPTDLRIATIKKVREVTGLGLKESKDLVDARPCVFKKNLTKREFQELLVAFEEIPGVKIVSKAID